MGVYFAFRSHYDNPAGKFLRRFDNDTVLEWFRQHWIAEPDADKAQLLALSILGCHVYTFHALFVGIAEQDIPPPTSMEAVAHCLNRFMYSGEVGYSEHAIERWTDDDQFDLVLHFFDDHFLSEHPERAAYLALEDWRLPVDAGDCRFHPTEAPRLYKLKGAGEGTVYLTFEDYYSKGNLLDIDDDPKAHRIEGVRLPDLCRLLAAADVGDDRDLRLLRSKIFEGYAPQSDEERPLFETLREDPADKTRWGIYADWLEERGREPPGVVLLENALRRVGAQAVDELPPGLNKPEMSQVAVSRHVAQLCRHTGQYMGDLYHHWILFDDLWASAHPDLANSMLRFASRRDLLTIDGSVTGLCS